MRKTAWWSFHRSHQYTGYLEDWAVGGRGGVAADVACGPGYCGGWYGNTTKVTVIDVSDLTNLKVQNEFFFAGQLRELAPGGIVGTAGAVGSLPLAIDREVLSGLLDHQLQRLARNAELDRLRTQTKRSSATRRWTSGCRPRRCGQPTVR